MCVSSQIFETMADIDAEHWTPAELADLLDCDAEIVRLQLDIMCAARIVQPGPLPDTYQLREEYAK